VNFTGEFGLIDIHLLHSPLPPLGGGEEGELRPARGATFDQRQLRVLPPPEAVEVSIV